MVTEPGMCPNRIIGEDGVARCRAAQGMPECKSVEEFPDWCVLEDTEEDIIEEPTPEPIWFEGKICRPIPDSPGYYARCDGTIISTIRGEPRPLSPANDGTGGYLFVAIYVNGVKKYKKVHRLVASAYVPNPDKKTVANHKDGVKTHNYASNLEWVTPSENTHHAVRTGLITGKRSAKAVIITNRYTGESETFYSTAQCAKRIGCKPETVQGAIRHGYILMKLYKAEYVNAEAPIDNNNETSSEVMA